MTKIRLFAACFFVVCICVYLLDGFLVKSPPNSWEKIKWGMTVGELRNLDTGYGFKEKYPDVIPNSIVEESEYWKLSIFIGHSNTVEGAWGYYKGYSLFHKHKTFVKIKEYVWD